MLSAKHISLLAGIFQQTALVLIIRYSKTVIQHDEASGPLYLSSVAVASAEVFKMCLSFILEFIQTRHKQTNDKDVDDNATPSTKDGGTISHIKRMIQPMLICNDKESTKLIIPAMLYLIQNNLLFVALANLSVPMYQVTNQGKLLTTALLSRIMLKKQLTGMQYGSIALLGFGVSFIHLSEYFEKLGEQGSVSSGGDETSGQNQILGLIAVLICCFTSGLSGVYFEWVLKKSPTQLSVHCRNFHLASWSLSFAILGILFSSNDMEQISHYGVFHGFNLLVVTVVIMQGITGFVVSMMIKYADTVLKGFAIAIAAPVATLVSVPVFGSKISTSFIVGGVMVAMATKMYSHFAPKKKDEEESASGTGSLKKDILVEEKEGLLAKDLESGPRS